MTDEKLSYQKELFFNRLSKQYKVLRKWARKNRVSSYRLYDKDIPEIPLALDLYTFLPPYIDTKKDAVEYENAFCSAISANGKDAKRFLEEEKNLSWAHLYLYERPYEKDEKEEELWFNEMALACAEVLGIEQSHVITKTRKKFSGTEEGRSEQYEKLNDSNHSSVTGLVFEQGELFSVNLTDYIDTGLFFDHRPLRKTVRENCKGKSVLNLFCYTGSFSVYAAEGGARFVQSVDLSNTYLEWAKKNLMINGFSDSEKYEFTRQDVLSFLSALNEDPQSKKFDVIVLDPPTFSNSKKTATTLDINRDWPLLVRNCMSLLSSKGVLYFSTNSRRLKFEPGLLSDFIGFEDFKILEITDSTIPEDYRNIKIHRAWKIVKS